MTQDDSKGIDPNSPGYTNALLEDMNGKFETMLEYVKDIPEMKEDIKNLKKQGDRSELRLDTWEESIKMIPGMQYYEH